ncbi:MAG: DUF5683 domain-containing protein [Candidatus Zhuqueibacterota bacterium]
MKQSRPITLLFVLIFMMSTGYAGEPSDTNGNAYSILSPSRSTEMVSKFVSPIASAWQDSTNLTREQQLAKLPGYKLPKKALFFSAVIPGTGELYAKSYWKAAAFFLIEASAWTYYGVYTKKGQDKESEYEDFADENWDPLKWKSWYENVPDEYKSSFTHASHMVDLLDEGSKTQQYYEMIGKYAEFVSGWEGARNDLTYEELLEYRRNECQIADDYMTMRAESNDLFDKAKTGTTIAMLNHLFSAIDAAWTAKRHNNSLIKTSLRIEQIYYADHLQPVLSLKMKW